jgi:hypothetical protein
VSGAFWKVLLAFAALTLVLAYPLSLDPGGRVLAVAADTDLFIWTLAWDVHALITRPLSIFDANIYYPEARTLAYSENLLGGALFAAPAWWATGNGVLAMNVTALASCALCGGGAWLLARRLGASTAAAWLAGIVFAFAPPRFFRLSQLHLTLIHWLPFALAFFHSYWHTGRRRDLRLALLFFTLQVLSSGHGAVFLTLALIALAVYNVALGEPIALRRRLSDVGLAGSALLVPALLVVLPYLAVQRQMQLRRSLADAATWTVSAASFLASPTHVHRFLLSQATDRPINDEAWAYLFPGYLPLVLAAAAFLVVKRNSRAETIWYGSVWTRAALALEVTGGVAAALAIYVLAAGPIRWRAGSTTLLSIGGVGRVIVVLAIAVAGRLLLARHVPVAVPDRMRRWREQTSAWRASQRADHRWFYALLLATTLWLSAAPPFGLWPAVYWLPGLNFIRVASRFTLLGVLCLAVLSAAGFDRLIDRCAPSRRALAGIIIGVLMIVEFAAIPLATSPYSAQPPAADVWLDTRPKPFSVAEVPVPTAHEGGEERRQTLYMLHSMAHWQKTVHGYSGLRPPLHAELFRQLRTFPDAPSLARLKELGVDYVVVHLDLYQSGEWLAVSERLRQFEGELTLEYEDAAARVYSLR